MINDVNLKKFLFIVALFVQQIDVIAVTVETTVKGDKGQVHVTSWFISFLPHYIFLPVSDIHSSLGLLDEATALEVEDKRRSTDS